MDSLSASAAAVQRAFDAAGVTVHVVELPSSTRTARDAASTLTCELGQIVKSIVFVGVTSGEPLLVLASGDHRIDESRLSELAGEPIRKASANEVRAHAGFAIGGVPPFGHPRRLRTVFDPSLLRFDQIWAAAGTPHAVFPIAPATLQRVVNGETQPVASPDSGAR